MFILTMGSAWCSEGCTDSVQWQTVRFHQGLKRHPRYFSRTPRRASYHYYPSASKYNHPQHTQWKLEENSAFMQYKITFWKLPILRTVMSFGIRCIEKLMKNWRKPEAPQRTQFIMSSHNLTSILREIPCRNVEAHLSQSSLCVMCLFKMHSYSIFHIAA